MSTIGKADLLGLSTSLMIAGMLGGGKNLFGLLVDSHWTLAWRGEWHDEKIWIMLVLKAFELSRQISPVGSLVLIPDQQIWKSEIET